MQRLLLGGMQLDLTGTDEQASGIIALSYHRAQLLVCSAVDRTKSQ